MAVAVLYAVGVGLFIRSRRARQARSLTSSLDKPVVAGLSELLRRRKLTREVTGEYDGEYDDEMFVCKFTESPYGRGAGEYAGGGGLGDDANEYAAVDGAAPPGPAPRALRFTSRLGESLSDSGGGGGRSGSTQSEIESTYDNRAGALKLARNAEQQAKHLGHRSWTGGSDGTVIYDNNKNLAPAAGAGSGRQASDASSAASDATYDDTNGVVGEYRGDAHADVEPFSAIYDNQMPTWLNEMIAHGTPSDDGSVTYDNRRQNQGIYGRLSRMTSDATSARSLPQNIYGRLSRHSSGATNSTSPYERATPSLLPQTMLRTKKKARPSSGIRRVARSQDIASSGLINGGGGGGGGGSSSGRHNRVPAHPRLRSLRGDARAGMSVKLELGQGATGGFVDSDGDSDSALILSGEAWGERSKLYRGGGGGDGAGGCFGLSAEAALERSPSGKRYSQGDDGNINESKIISRMNSIDSALSAQSDLSTGSVLSAGYIKVRGNNAKESAEAAPTRKQLLAARKVLGDVLSQLQDAKAEVALAKRMGGVQ